MRLRLPFAGIFLVLLLLAAYLGLTTHDAAPPIPLNDKVLHLLTFFLLTLAFYWVVDTTRRRALNLTLLACTLGLGLGSEVLQALLPNGRAFDLLDVAANLVGSLAALALCGWYHKRMLERRRLRKYTAVPTAAGGEADLELGEGPGIIGGSGDGGEHEEGVTSGGGGGGGGESGGVGQRATTLEEEVDNWDENAVDAWDEDDGDGSVSAPAGTTKGIGAEANGGDHDNAKKRSD
ncbi:hypothetical protein VTK26DRAFT_8654 [Humicola hyalothermophila]